MARRAQVQAPVVVQRPGRYLCPRCGFLVPFASRITVGVVTCLPCWFASDLRVAMEFVEDAQ